MHRFHEIMLWLHYLVVIGEITRWSWEARRFAAAGRRAQDQRREVPVNNHYYFAPTMRQTNVYYGTPPVQPAPPTGFWPMDPPPEIRRR
ncbi:hypothetical protein ACFY64_32070 [Streptomyces collinus]|uniref:hypothetical protein n=1 Tax=Streptomyces collinus TaxID=42684 RepID=UPI0036981257